MELPQQWEGLAAPAERSSLARGEQQQLLLVLEQPPEALQLEA
jgi:hypothetical protein